MILKGSQRGGPRQLAAHLLNVQDNDHVKVEELRGFVASGLKGAMAEVEAIARGTQCRQAVFSLSLNPPGGAFLTPDEFRETADRAEAALGLQGQPRALVIHEKNGRRHAHVVWSRIDADQMKAINLPFTKNRLMELSKELYLERGWELPEGFRANGWKNPLNFDLAEWQQAKRHDLDPRELKQVFQTAWRESDSLPALRQALEERGLYLARGDRRGVVALDAMGDVYALSRWTGIRTKELEGRIGKDAAAKLPSVSEVGARLKGLMSRQLRGFIAEDKAAKAAELQPLMEERSRMVARQRTERQQLQETQQERSDKEAQARAAQFRSGFLGKALDLLTGRAGKLRRQHAEQLKTANARDAGERDGLAQRHLKDRSGLQERLDALRIRHRAERQRLAQRIAGVWREAGFNYLKGGEPQGQMQERLRRGPAGPELER